MAGDRVGMRRCVGRLVGLLRRGYLGLEDKPLVIVLTAAGATVGVSLVLASEAGWPRVLRLMYARHSWAWLAVCLVGELAAYGGYVLTVRDMARVDDGSELELGASVRTVVAGFGVFAATRSSGGFAVDYWAFRQAGTARREAVRRVLGLGFLEYAGLSVGALAASMLLWAGRTRQRDRHAAVADRRPSVGGRTLADLAQARQAAQSPPPRLAAGTVRRLRLWCDDRPTSSDEPARAWPGCARHRPLLGR